ncbi:hypothetical protein [Azospirillum rugosum]|uniref:Uncharacterized protein n=1 Tax=Azospirillum rugosum TaxID=416170 RepID=A0ABS4SEB1_9PROT|nr:hypothetical protein [Azospirillum rugosum]MBP2290524.1 hypothetical protein [Azospirillum rugosum]MDQ0525412.1 hypothetical protein [Azospirillum rugosum]
MEETKLTAALPNMDIQILHREDPERGAEMIAVQITATPSFDAALGQFGPALMRQMLQNTASNPMMANPLMANPMMALWAAPMQAWTQAWTGMVRQAWAPWLRLPAGDQK